MTLPPRVVPPTQSTVPQWCARDAMAVSHVVAHDAAGRGPFERARMLSQTGIGRIVWDWAPEHLAGFETELDALSLEGIDLAGLWTPLPMPHPDEPDHNTRFGHVTPAVRHLVSTASRRGLRPDLWTQIAFGHPGAPRELTPQAHRAEVQRAATHLTPLTHLALSHGMCVVLTNHGGWAGEPRTMMDVVAELAARGITNVGIALRLQHAHHLIPDLDTHLAHLGDSLVAVMLSGSDAGAELSGRTVIPFGTGSRDRWVTHALLDSGWQGQLLVHAVGRDDARSRLLDSLEGWEWSVDRYLGRVRTKPRARVLAPLWPPPLPQLPHHAQPPTPPAASSAALPSGPILSEPITPEPIPSVSTAGAQRIGEPDAAAVFFAAIARSEQVPSPAPTQAFAPPPAPTPSHAPSPLATIPHARSLHTEDHAFLRAAKAAPQGPPAAALGMSRRERRALRDQHDAAARHAARTTRDAQRAAARGPERIGHGQVRIVAPDPYTGALHALLLHLEDEGFDGAPRSFGWDDQGRHLVEFVPGQRADHPYAPEDALEPRRIGLFLRRMHDALASFEPPPDARWFDGIPAPGDELIVHHDIAPSNIVVRADGSLVAIDWDAAGPGTRLWDLAYAAHAFVPLYRQGADPAGSARRLRHLVDGYGLDGSEREELVPLLAARSQRMYDYLDLMRTTGQSPWVELWQRGVGTVWRSDAQWIADHSGLWREALFA